MEKGKGESWAGSVVSDEGKTYGDQEVKTNSSIKAQQATHTTALSRHKVNHCYYTMTAMLLYSFYKYVLFYGHTIRLLETVPEASLVR